MWNCNVISVFVCLSVRLTDQQFLSVMLSWMCCAIQNINKPQRPEDQFKEAAQLVLAAHSLKKYYESKNLRTLCYIYLLLLLHLEISLFFHVTGPWWVLNPTNQKTVQKALFLFGGRCHIFFHGNVGYQIGCANKDLRLFLQSSGDFRSKTRDFYGSLGICLFNG